MAVTQMEQEQALLEALKAVIDPQHGERFCVFKSAQKRQHHKRRPLKRMVVNEFTGDRIVAVAILAQLPTPIF